MKKLNIGKYNIDNIVVVNCNPIISCQFGLSSVSNTKLSDDDKEKILRTRTLNFFLGIKNINFRYL